jgi:hypothetical protein
MAPLGIGGLGSGNRAVPHERAITAPRGSATYLVNAPLFA